VASASLGTSLASVSLGRVEVHAALKLVDAASDPARGLWTIAIHGTGIHTKRRPEVEGAAARFAALHRASVTLCGAHVLGLLLRTIHGLERRARGDGFGGAAEERDWDERGDDEVSHGGGFSWWGDPQVVVGH
jgi:hypothetical protein